MKANDSKNKRRGYFGIGVCHPKTSENIGTLMRSAYQMGASFVFVIGKRYKKQASDTCKAFKHIPLIQFSTIDDFTGSMLYDCKLVGIEFDENGKNLPRYQHPERAVYILGAEDSGIPKILKEKIHEFIEIPFVRQPSYNVSVAGSIVMYDRLSKYE